MDAGTVERWIDPGYQRVYAKVFAGDWRGYDPSTPSIASRRARSPSPAGRERFSHLPGLDGFDAQGPKDGTLRLIPIAEGISYVLLRAMQDDVPENDLCGAAPGRALGVKPEWHADMMAGTSPFPK